MKDNVDYSHIMNASKVFCPYQYLCRITGKTENSPMAKDCYKSRLAEQKAR